jgi:ABC-2 type transport system permease protein
VRLFEMLYWPLLELLIWGYVSIYLQVSKVPAVVAALLGGVLLWQVLARSQGEVSIAFMEDIWSRNLLNVFASPLTTGEYLAGMIGFGFAKLVAATALMGALAFAFYGFGLLSLGPALVPFLFLLLLMGWALGIFAVAVVVRFGHSAEIVAWALAFAFQPFAAVFYPVAILPGPMQAVAAFVPASHVFEGCGRCWPAAGWTAATWPPRPCWTSSTWPGRSGSSAACWSRPGAPAAWPASPSDQA